MTAATAVGTTPAAGAGMDAAMAGAATGALPQAAGASIAASGAHISSWAALLARLGVGVNMTAPDTDADADAATISSTMPQQKISQIPVQAPHQNLPIVLPDDSMQTDTLPVASADTAANTAVPSQRGAASVHSLVAGVEAAAEKSAAKSSSSVDTTKKALTHTVRAHQSSSTKGSAATPDTDAIPQLAQLTAPPLAADAPVIAAQQPSAASQLTPSSAVSIAAEPTPHKARSTAAALAFVSTPAVPASTSLKDSSEDVSQLTASASSMPSAAAEPAPKPTPLPATAAPAASVLPTAPAHANALHTSATAHAASANAAPLVTDSRTASSDSSAQTSTDAPVSVAARRTLSTTTAEASSAVQAIHATHAAVQTAVQAPVAAPVHTSAPSTPQTDNTSAAATQPALTPASAATALDSADASARISWTHASPQRAEASIDDPVLGTVSVRAQTEAGQMHATLVPVSADAALSLGTHLAGLNAYLAERHAGVDSLQISAPDSSLAGNVSSGFDGSAQSGPQDNSGQTHSGAEVRSDFFAAPHTAAAPASAITASLAPVWAPADGHTISVLA